MNFSIQTRALSELEATRIQIEFDRLSGEELAAKVAGDFFTQTRVQHLKDMEINADHMKKYFCGLLSGGDAWNLENRIIAHLDLSEEEAEQFYDAVSLIKTYARNYR